ncbi:Uncharacterized protein APZ42_000369, partial [Daphnia magna]
QRENAKPLIRLCRLSDDSAKTISANCRKPFRQIAENHFGKVAELSPMKLPIRQKSIRQLCKCKLAANTVEYTDKRIAYYLVYLILTSSEVDCDSY